MPTRFVKDETCLTDNQEKGGKMKKKTVGRIMGGFLAAMLAFPVAGVWAVPGAYAEAAGSSADGAEARSETAVTKIQAEDAVLSLEIGTDMTSQFVKETEPSSDEGGHIKTSKIGASVTLQFEGTGIRFYTKCGNGAGKLSVQIDGGDRRKSMST